MNTVDLFAGAGGLSCGLEMAGFKSVVANELVPVYSKTYKLNHPDSDVFIGDLRNEGFHHLVEWKKIHPKVTIDLVAGGPPCQGFSVNAPVRSLDDPRNHLFKDYLKVVELFMPRAVLIENVPGIISLGKGTVIEQIYQELKGLGYSVSHRILFAGHYGVPQMRFRTIILAIKGKKKEIYFPEPTHNATAVANFQGAKELCISVLPMFAQSLLKHTSVWDAISDLPLTASNKPVAKEILKYTKKPSNEFQKLMRNESAGITNHYCSRLSDINIERLKHIPQGGSWRDIPFDLLPAGLQRARRSDHTKRYGRLHPDALCSTVLTKCDPHWGSFFHPFEERIITVREAARIQSFPDKYEFVGSLTEQYAQVGNAVPPLLAKAIGNAIIKNLEK